MFGRLILAAIAASAVATAGNGQLPPSFDLRVAPSINGSWSYAPVAGGSEAAFMDAGTVRRLVLRCTAARRTVTVAMTSTVSAPMITVLATDGGRMLPARFDARGFQLSADVPADDPLLDAIVFSRGQIALSITGLPPMVVPVWAEAARVIEDCRG